MPVQQLVSASVRVIWAAIWSLTWCGPAIAQSASPPWKYDLRPGDHLVYRYSFEREFKGETQSKTRAQFTTHVLVTGEQNGRLSIGFQRNRQTADLLLYREKGHDKLAQELPKFQNRMARRPVRFSEANEFSPTGVGLDYWQVNRENTSRMLFAVHETEALPQTAVKIGDTWRGGGLLSWNFRLAALENLGDTSCYRVEGKAAPEGAELVYWWCPVEGFIRKLIFYAEYPGGEGETIVERAVFELTERRRHESLETWLRAPDTQQAAMQSLLLSPWAVFPLPALEEVLHSNDGEVQSQALAILFQRHLAVTDRNRVVELSASNDPLVKSTAAQLLDAKPAATAPSRADECPAPPPKYIPQRLGTSLRVVADGRGDQLFMVHVPLDYRGDRPFPLLIYLSGGAGFAIDGVRTGDDVLSQSEYIVVYPQAGGLWWKPEIASRVDALLKHVLDEFNVDRNRVYVAGYSNGGTGALYYATLWPQRFAAVVSLMGAGQCIPEIADSLPNVVNLLILFVHGDKDPLISADCSQETYTSLMKLSPRVHPEFHILKGRAHEITLETDDGLSLPFLQKQERDPSPTRVSARWSDLSYPRRYWV